MVTGAAESAPAYTQIDVVGHAEKQPWVDPKASATELEAALKREGIDHSQIVQGGSIYAYSRHGEKNVMCINSANSAVLCNVIGSADLQLANTKGIITYFINEKNDQPAVCMVSSIYNGCKYIRKTD